MFEGQNARRLPQLRMRKKNLNDFDIVLPPPGYEVRSYKVGDEMEWVDIINASFGDAKWNMETVHKNLTDRSEFDPKGLFFITHMGKPVGTCCAWRIPEKHKVGYVHMLGVKPRHQGKELGYILVLYVLKYFKDKGFEEAILDTDDFRLAAIKTYLRLGFKPVYTDESHLERWEAVRRALSGLG